MTRRLLHIARYVVEIVIIALWASYIARPYLNTDPWAVPSGLDYGSSMQSHFLWDHVRSCGLCAFWNGDVRGGAPAFADLHGDMLHPAVIAPSLLFGALNGAKIALCVGFFLSGLAQWWLAKLLGLDRFARVWSGLVGAAAGNVVGRIENGNVAMVTSTAACALLVPALMNVYQNPTRRSSVLLGFALAGAAVAGQGYMQAGALFLMPLSLILIAQYQLRNTQIFWALGSGAMIGALLAAPFLIPFFRLWSSFDKDRVLSFDSAQPLTYIPSNFVLGDYGEYLSESLGRLPYPYLYVNFVGWIVVLFAMFGLITLWRPSTRPTALFLGIWIVGSIWLGSAALFEWLLDRFSSSESIVEPLTSIRFPSLITGLAVPP